MLPLEDGDTLTLMTLMAISTVSKSKGRLAVRTINVFFFFQTGCEATNEQLSKEILHSSELKQKEDCRRASIKPGEISMYRGKGYACETENRIPCRSGVIFCVF